MVLAKVAFNPVCGCITPRQLGPIMRILPRASSRISFSNFCPRSPISLNPADIIIAPLTPAATHSPTIPGTVEAGVTMIANSTGSGTALMLG